MHRFAFAFVFAFALVALASAGCATSRQVAAQQQNAIGGGFVAVGAVTATSGAVSAIVTLAVLSDGNSIPATALSNLAVAVLAGALVEAAVITTGVVMMKMAEGDLGGPPPPVEDTEAPAPPAFPEDD